MKFEILAMVALGANALPAFDATFDCAASAAANDCHEGATKVFLNAEGAKTGAQTHCNRVTRGSSAAVEYWA